MLSFGFINVVLFVRCRPFRHHRLLLSPSRCRRPLVFTSSSLSLPLFSFAVSPAPLLLLSILLRSRRRSSMCNWKRQIYSAGVRTRQIYLFLSLRCTSTTPCCLRSLHLHPKSTWLLLNHIRPCCCISAPFRFRPLHLRCVLTPLWTRRRLYVVPHFVFFISESRSDASP